MSDHHDEMKKLLTRVIDSADGYEQAAEAAESGALKGIFEERGQMRRRFVGELRNELKRDGVEVDDDGSLLAATHRLFLDLKTKVSGKDNERVLEEIERGESALVEQYEDTLKEMAATHRSRQMLQDQLNCVRKDLTSAKQLEQAAE